MNTNYFLVNLSEQVRRETLLDEPSSHLSRQNQVQVPLPTTTEVEASNIARSTLSQAEGSADPVLSDQCEVAMPS
jgi:hypothetical protein